MHIDVECPLDEDDCWFVSIQPDSDDFWFLPNSIIGGGSTREKAFEDVKKFVSMCENAFRKIKEEIYERNGK